jgi:ATP-dependent Lhr-like helicase
VVDYSPALLDDLTSSGEVLWRGHGSLPGDDGWVSLHLADTAHLTLAPPSDLAVSEQQQALLDALAGGGAYFFRTLSDALGSLDDEALLADLWSLTWAGQVSNDTLTPLRAHLAGGRTTHTRGRSGPRATRYAGRRGSLGALSGQRGAGRPAMPVRGGPPTGAGRWSLLPSVETDATVRAYATAEVLLDRYGVVTRGSVVAEDVPGGFAAVYRVLAAAEESGRVRRGYFVESLGASQFSTTGAIDRLRAGARVVGAETDPSTPALVLAATDPANAYGAAVPWPDRGSLRGDDQGEHAGHEGDDSSVGASRRGHQPARKAGALVVLVDGELVLYVERGGKTLLSWTDEPQPLQSAADALALAVREGALGRLTVEKADGDAVLGSDHPLAGALSRAGFRATPRGLRLRR